MLLLLLLLPVPLTPFLYGFLFIFKETITAGKTWNIHERFSWICKGIATGTGLYYYLCTCTVHVASIWKADKALRDMLLLLLLVSFFNGHVVRERSAEAKKTILDPQIPLLLLLLTRKIDRPNDFLLLLFFSFFLFLFSLFSTIFFSTTLTLSFLSPFSHGSEER